MSELESVFQAVQKTIAEHGSAFDADRINRLIGAKLPIAEAIGLIRNNIQVDAVVPGLTPYAADSFYDGSATFAAFNIRREGRKKGELLLFNQLEFPTSTDQNERHASRVRYLLSEASLVELDKKRNKLPQPLDEDLDFKYDGDGSRRDSAVESMTDYLVHLLEKNEEFGAVWEQHLPGLGWVNPALDPLASIHTSMLNRHSRSVIATKQRFPRPLWLLASGQDADLGEANPQDVAKALLWFAGQYITR